MSPSQAPGAGHEEVRLSVIIPVYNEEQTVDVVLRRVLAGLAQYRAKEVIVVDDGSRDRTRDRLEPWVGVPGVLILRHPENLGKGAAVRTGMACVRGDITVIQDADLEYDPRDLPGLIEIVRKGRSDVVYGSRYGVAGRRLPWTRFRLAVSVLNGLVRLLYGRRLTDEATCYKVLRTRLLRALDLRASRFDLCAEITAKVCRLGLPIVEVPISYRPRGRQEGKKISWRDGWEAIWTLCKWRFVPLDYGLGEPEVSGDRQRLSGSRGERLPSY